MQSGIFFGQVLSDKPLMTFGYRIPWGSSHVTEYLLKLIQLKYPTFPTRVTSSQANVRPMSSDGRPKSHKCLQWMLQTFCEFSSDYPSHLRSLSDPVKLSRSGKIIQFPFSQSSVDEKTEEEQTRLAERRKEQGKRLQEMAAKARMEKVSIECVTVNHDRYGYFSWKPKRGIYAKCWS